MENKQTTLDLLQKAIQSTRAGHDVVELKYFDDGCYDMLCPEYYHHPGQEVVRVTFESGGHRYINVAMDSAWGCIIDVIKHIDI